jgi:hypothetical protein
LAVAALLAALAFPVLGQAGQAAAAGTTTFQVVNAYSYAAGHPFTLTVCLDGTKVTSLATTEVQGPFSHATGDAELTIVNGNQADCATDPDIDTTVTFPAGTATLMIYWPPGTGMTANVLADDTSCTDSGMGRLTFRNGAGDSAAAGVVDVFGTPPAGSDTKLFSAVAPGAQASSDLATGTYSDTRAVQTGTSTVVFDGGDAVIAEAQDTQLYLYGGDDGAVGGFSHTSDLTVCAVATTSTTVAPTTTTTAAAQPVAATPAFTG